MQGRDYSYFIFLGILVLVGIDFVFNDSAILIYIVSKVLDGAQWVNETIFGFLLGKLGID